MWRWIAFILLLPGVAEAGKAQGAFWRSLLVPGWGQQYAQGGGGGFLAAELALWGGYWGFEWLGQVRRDRYEAYAAERAGARPEGKGDDYFDDLGFYASRLQHNQFARYEDGLDAELYPVEADFFWEWDRDESRLRYRELRNSSQHAQRQALYVTGLVVVNHLVAAIHAARVASADQAQTGFAPKVAVGPAGAAFFLVRHFY